MKELLIVIDMQNDFVFGALGTKEAQAILPAVQETIVAARANHTEIVFTRDTHTEEYLSTQEASLSEAIISSSERAYLAPPIIS